MEDEKNQKTKFYIKLFILAVLILIFLGLIVLINTGTHTMARKAIMDIFYYIVYGVNYYWITIILSGVLFIYNIIKKNNIKKNALLIIWTILISVTLESLLGILLLKGDFIIRGEEGISIPPIPNFSTILLLIILGSLSIKGFLEYRNNYKTTTKINRKYILGITIIILATIFTIIYKIGVVYPIPKSTMYIENFYKDVILEERLKSYLKILPQLILYIQIYIAFIANNLKKCEKKDKGGNHL